MHRHRCLPAWVVHFDEPDLCRVMREKVYGVTTVFLFFKRKKEQLQKTSSGEGLLGADPCAALNGLLHHQLLRVV